MKNTLLVLLGIILLSSCEEETPVSSLDPENWNKRLVGEELPDSLLSGESYLSVYSQIYSISEHRTHDLTATISMRNTNKADSIYITSAEYYNSHGELIRTYIKQPVFIGPMETVEIVIDETDKEGGTGANFLFYWKTRPEANAPLFEGVMISTSGQQGLSFTTQGKQIK